MSQPEKKSNETTIKVGLGCLIFIILFIILAYMGLLDPENKTGGMTNFIGVVITIALLLIGWYLTKDT